MCIVHWYNTMRLCIHGRFTGYTMVQWWRKAQVGQFQGLLTQRNFPNPEIVTLALFSTVSYGVVHKSQSQEPVAERQPWQRAMRSSPCWSRPSRLSRRTSACRASRWAGRCKLRYHPPPGGLKDKHHHTPGFSQSLIGEKRINGVFSTVGAFNLSPALVLSEPC